MAHGQWWRNGHSHIDESEIWLVREGTGADLPEYRPVSVGGKNLWPMWGSTSDRVYFVSDRDGAENVWTATVDGSAEERLTDFTGGRVVWPSMTTDGSAIAFERDFSIWTYDVAGDEIRRLDVRLMGSVEGPTPETEVVESGWSDIAVSPDDEKWAFIRGGEVFATTMEGDIEATRVTHTPAAEDGIAWSADSRLIVYGSWRTGTPKIYAYDFTTQTERQVTEGSGRDQVGGFSPDGRWLLYARLADEERELRVRDWESGDDRLLATAVAGAAPSSRPTSHPTPSA